MSREVASAITEARSEEIDTARHGFLLLESLRDPAALDFIREQLESKDARVRAYALRALIAIEGVPAVDDLLRALATDRSAMVRRAALFGLEPYQKLDARILPAWMAAMKDKDTDVRIAAVDVVSRVDDPEAHAIIRYHKKHERRGDVKRALNLAVDRI